MIVDKILSFLDKYIHKKRIIKFLEDKFIVTVIDIGSHKGEFINSVLNISSVSNVISFEPQKNIFDLYNKKYFLSQINYN